MNDELDVTDPLANVVRVLREPAPIAPGLGARARARQRRRDRMLRLGATGAALSLVVLAVTRYRSPGTAVTFALTAPAVHSVSLVGDFNDWRTEGMQLERNKSGLWQATVRLPPGRYRFAYLVDHEQWRADTRSPSAPDDFGRPTSVLTVTGN